MTEKYKLNNKEDAICRAICNIINAAASGDANVSAKKIAQEIGVWGGLDK